MIPRVRTSVRRSIIVGAALFAGATAQAAPSVQFIYGATQVALSSEFVGALGSLGVTPDNVLPGGLTINSRGARAALPIPGGDLDATGPKLEILHSGGLTLTAGSTRVALTSFIIENLGGRLQLTGLVKTNDDIVGRIPLFDVALTRAPEVSPLKRRKGASQFELDGARVTLAAPAAAALNAVFGVSAFTEGFPIGVAEIDAVIADRD